MRRKKVGYLHMKNMLADLLTYQESEKSEGNQFRFPFHSSLFPRASPSHYQFSLAVFVFICVLCDVVVFWYSRNSELFDECPEDLQKRRGCSEEDQPLRSVAYDEAKV